LRGENTKLEVQRMGYQEASTPSHPSLYIFPFISLPSVGSVDKPREVLVGKHHFLIDTCYRGISDYDNKLYWASWSVLKIGLV